jgi:hypothetical protein
MMEGFLDDPDLPSWAREYLRLGYIGFYKERVPEAIGFYWLKVKGGYAKMAQGDWFVLLQEDPMIVKRFPPLVFQEMFGAKEVLAPGGDLSQPITRTYVVYDPTDEGRRIADDIEDYISKVTEDWLNKAYYHHLEMVMDALRNGAGKTRVQASRIYHGKLTGQAKKAKYWKLLGEALDELEKQVQ